jgi:hypothetical protein
MVEQIAPLVKLTNGQSVGGYIFVRRLPKEHSHLCPLSHLSSLRRRRIPNPGGAWDWYARALDSVLARWDDGRDTDGEGGSHVRSTAGPDR